MTARRKAVCTNILENRIRESSNTVNRVYGRREGDLFLLSLVFSGAADDEDSRQEVAADEDSNCSVNQNFDAKLSRASSLYQGPSSGQSCTTDYSILITKHLT